MSKKRTIDLPDDLDKSIQRLAEKETEGKFNPMMRKLLREVLTKKRLK